MTEAHFRSAANESLLASSKMFFFYGGAGAVGTAFHFGVLFATLSLMGPVLASTLGAIVAASLTTFWLGSSSSLRPNRTASLFRVLSQSQSSG